MGPRVYEIAEVNQLVPELERIFRELGAVRARIKAQKLKLNALEMIWGEAIHDPDTTDHKEYTHLSDEMRKLQHEFERITEHLAELGGQLKGLDPPLVDFYGVRDGRLVFWCWTEGDERIDHWHHVDEGFVGRQPV